MSNVTSGGEECYREREHSWRLGGVCTGGMEVGASESPLSCLTLGSVRAQTVYKEGVRAS